MSRMALSSAFRSALFGGPSRLAAVRGILVASFVSLLASSALAAPPDVTVDVSTNVECRDISSPEFSKSHPNDKLVEATFHVSVLLKSGHEEDLQELHLLIASPERRLRVVDFRPRTEVASELAGDVEAEQPARIRVTRSNASLARCS